MTNNLRHQQPPTAKWRKSSWSNGDNACVEVTSTDAAVHIRDSKYTGEPSAQPIITVTTTEWSTFLHATLYGGPAIPAINRDTDGYVTLSHNGIDLTYTPAEWKAFVSGVVAGEFSRTEALTA